MHKYALISWTQGPDRDAVSIVPSSWIIDFDPEDMSKTYLVECRIANTKKPTNGWQVEQAVVLQLADKESTLKSAERALLKVDSPKGQKRIRRPKRLLFEDEEDSATTAGGGNIGISKKKQKKDKLAAQKCAEREILSEDQLSLGLQSPEESSSNEYTFQIRDLQNQIKVLQKENARLRNMVVKEIPAVLTDIRKVLQKVNPAEDAPIPQAEAEAETAPSEVKMGTGGVSVSAHCWETAKAQKTANGMARVLLMGLFNTDILLRSNLTGGKNKVDPTADRRQALDGKKLQALQDAVLNHHPGTKISDIRKSLNTRICELRHQSKQRRSEAD